MNLVDELKKIQKARKWSQERMAREIGLNTAMTYHRWVSKKFKPSLVMKEKILAYLSKEKVL